MNDNTRILRHQVELMLMQGHLAKTVDKYTLGLEFAAGLTPDPLYYSGREKKLGEPRLWAYLEVSAGPTRTRLQLISFHLDEIGVLYEDAPLYMPRGIFPIIRLIPQAAPGKETVTESKERKSYNVANFAELIDALQFEHRLNQRDFAAKLGFSASRLSEYAHRKRKVNIEFVRKLYHVFHVDADLLLTLPD
jgi:plasmid maintenance system antidote protein VapI